jgi:exopolyphosphatase/guanosine-5'-triphosphate,3'-diphosphate pyrophosphatase
MHNYELGLDEMDAFLKLVAGGELGQIRGAKRISKTRRALLPYGAAVLREIIDAMQPKNIVVSAFGVREGYLHALLSPEERRRDPLISSAEELAILRSRSVTHARELAAWTDEAFAVFGIEESEDEARYRRAACLLADIGWRAHPEYRGTQSLNIIAHASFIGIDHPGRAFIALANLFRHEGIYEDDVSPAMKALAGPRYIERARILGALLRVVYLFSASMPGMMPKLKWREGEDRKLSLVVPASHADLLGERPDSRMEILARVLDRPMEIVVG